VTQRTKGLVEDPAPTWALKATLSHRIEFHRRT